MLQLRRQSILFQINTGMVVGCFPFEQHCVLCCPVSIGNSRMVGVQKGHVTRILRVLVCLEHVSFGSGCIFTCRRCRCVGNRHVYHIPQEHGPHGVRQAQTLMAVVVVAAACCCWLWLQALYQLFPSCQGNTRPRVVGMNVIGANAMLLPQDVGHDLVMIVVFVFITSQGQAEQGTPNGGCHVRCRVRLVACRPQGGRGMRLKIQGLRQVRRRR